MATGTSSVRADGYSKFNNEFVNLEETLPSSKKGTQFKTTIL